MTRVLCSAFCILCSAFCILCSAFCVLCLPSCLPAPDAPDNSNQQLLPDGVFVVCEGLWRQDNSVLSYINVNNTVVRDVVGVYNEGFKLGDTSSDVVEHNDTLIISVSTSQSLCLVDKRNGKFLKRITFSDGKQPYRLAKSNSGKLYCTNVNDDSITEYDIATALITIPRLAVGPAPEGIGITNGKIYVAISGYGDLRKDEQGAGTIRVLSLADLTTIATIDGLPNAAQIATDQTRRFVWASYRHFASQPDSLGGVVLIDATADTMMQRWRLKAPTDIVIDETSGIAFVLHANGIEKIDPTTGSMSNVSTFHSANGSDVWYSLGIDLRRNILLIGNARQYVTDGEVIEMDYTGKVIARHNVGVNPVGFAY